MDAVIHYSTAGFASEARAAEIEAFFVAHPLPSNQRSIAQLLEATRTTALFAQRIKGSDMANDAFWASLQF